MEKEKKELFNSLVEIARYWYDNMDDNGAKFTIDCIIEELYELKHPTPTWQDQPTTDGFWLMYDYWIKRPELVIIKDFGKADQSISYARTSGRMDGKIQNLNMLNKAKWYGPITPPED